MKDQKLFPYNPTEEKLNIYTHLIGTILSCIALPFLIIQSFKVNKGYPLFSFVIFGLSMITLYMASTLYHASKVPQKRSKLKIFDHAAIYVLIAGTYSPFALVSLADNNGWLVFIIVWTFALIGIILKLFFTGKYDIISTLMYVFMGWLIVFFFSDLKNNLDIVGINWLIAGGISYTIGAILYSIKKIPYNHAIFHIFVLIGTICHFITIFNHVK